MYFENSLWCVLIWVYAVNGLNMVRKFLVIYYYTNIKGFYLLYIVDLYQSCVIKFDTSLYRFSVLWLSSALKF